jgi:hypothetical protein
LLFLNDQSVLEFSENMAETIMPLHPTNDERIHEVFIRLFAKGPSANELEQCNAYLVSQRALFAADPNPEWQKTIEKSSHAPDIRALASLCQTLMASNRFLYID